MKIERVIYGLLFVALCIGVRGYVQGGFFFQDRCDEKSARDCQKLYNESKEIEDEMKKGREEMEKTQSIMSKRAEEERMKQSRYEAVAGVSLSAEASEPEGLNKTKSQ